MMLPDRLTQEERVFRSSPGYELVLFERLPESERALIGELVADPSFYGVLRPVNGETRSLRAVDRDTALLFLTLREPSPLPGYVLRSTNGEGVRAVTELVMDGVLEVWDGSGFATGPRGGAVLLAGEERTEAGGHLASLSRAALRYAAALGLDDRHALAGRLYAYNRIPLSPRWRESLPDHHAVLSFASTGRDNAWRGFVPGRPAEPGGWIPFLPRSGPKVGEARQRNGRGGGHKLYISPLPDHLPGAMAEVVDVLARFPILQFKLGGDAGGVLRPDKLVAYFSDPADLVEAGQALAEQLAGIPAQGVPFTAPLTDDGLISWGIDPPANQRPLSWMPTESWRFWVVRNLAAALAEASRSGADAAMPPDRFALERLRLQGVDVERWVPSGSLWREDR